MKPEPKFYKFSIITPTHNRPEILRRAIDSVLDQKYSNWEMLIVNDSPDCDYTETENLISKDNRIKYFKNVKNMGKNFSCNFALDNLSTDSDYVILLDDDDWLTENALTEACSAINNNSNHFWYVSNRFDCESNVKLTINNTSSNVINYIKDYLLLKRFKGDATHIISTKYIKDNNITFSKKIKNGEEWFMFAQINHDFFYYNYDSTYTQGYSFNGLNMQMNKKYLIKNTFPLMIESLNKFKYSPLKLLLCVIYLKLRFIKQLIK